MNIGTSPARLAHMPIAVFDLCGTLYDSNTTFDFLDFYFHANSQYQRERNVMRTAPFRALNRLSRYLTKREIIREKLIRFLHDIPRRTLLEAAAQFAKSELENKRIDKVHELLDRYRAEKTKTILMSASLDFIVEEIAKMLSFDNFHATSLEYVNGVCTGRIKYDLLFHKAEIFFKTYGINEPFDVITNDRYDSDLVGKAGKAYIIADGRANNYWRNRFSQVTFLE
jgi:HAD superfamily phosphoserine phosphatase-like hydrolase